MHCQQVVAYATTESTCGSMVPRKITRCVNWSRSSGSLPIGHLTLVLAHSGACERDLLLQTLPETHTCTRELHLPNYSTAEVLRDKLLLALTHAADGFFRQ